MKHPIEHPIVTIDLNNMVSSIANEQQQQVLNWKSDQTAATASNEESSSPNESSRDDEVQSRTEELNRDDVSCSTSSIANEQQQVQNWKSDQQTGVTASTEKSSSSIESSTDDEVQIRTEEVISDDTDTVSRVCCEVHEVMLSFQFCGKNVPVVHNASIPREVALVSIQSTPFLQWAAKSNRTYGTKRIDIRSVEIQSVDFAADTGRIDMIKINADMVLIDEEIQVEDEVLPGVCCLRANSIALLVELVCVDDGSSWSLLVDHPRYVSSIEVLL